jgi:hypothetical protein
MQARELEELMRPLSDVSAHDARLRRADRNVALPLPSEAVSTRA